MIELLCVLCGAVCAVLVQRLRQRLAERTRAPSTEPRQDAQPPVAQPAAASPTAPAPSPTNARPELLAAIAQEPEPISPTSSQVLDTVQLARSLAEELATLVSGVEGRAHHLIETAPDLRQLPITAEALLAAVQRLRHLHGKLVAFGRNRPVESGRTSLEAALVAITDELRTLQLGLEVRRESAAHLPMLGVGPGVVHDTLRYVGAAMQRAERGATNLTISTELCFRDDEPVVQVELVLEWSDESPPNGPTPFADAAYALDVEAANQLLHAHGGELALSHLPGRSIRAVLRWPLAMRHAENELPTEAPEPGPARTTSNEPAPVGHRYGGALLLEADVAVRELLSRELKATGRAVFACADGAAARSFLLATPERFELLIVDHQERLDDDQALAATIRAVAPRLCILVLSPVTPPTLRTWPDLRSVAKPFGVHELRQALASIPAAG